MWLFCGVLRLLAVCSFAFELLGRAWLFGWM